MSSRNPTGAIKALLDEQTREMYNLVEGSARPVNGALRGARNSMAGALLAFLAKRDPQEPFTRSDYQRAVFELRRTSDVKLAQMGGSVARKLPEWVGPLRTDLTRMLRQKAAEAGEMAAGHAQKQARAMGIAAGAITAEEVTRRGSRQFGKRLSGYASEQAEAPYTDIKRRLAMGVTTGLTLAELVRDLMRVGGRRGPIPDVNDALAVANAVADAIFGVASRSARRVFVTELSSAYNVQMLIAMKGMGLTLKRWDSSNDLKVCRQCSSMHGRITELHKTFPNGSQGPPLHPNCRCCVTVWRDDSRRGVN